MISAMRDGLMVQFSPELWHDLKVIRAFLFHACIARLRWSRCAPR